MVKKFKAVELNGVWLLFYAMSYKREETEVMDKRELYLKELTVFLEEAGRYFKLFPMVDVKTESVAKKNLEIIRNLAETEREVILEIQGDCSEEEKEEIAEILEGINKFIDQAQAPEFDHKKLQEIYQDLSKVSEQQRTEQTRNEILRKVFQFDIDEMRLHESKLRALQDAVDLDMKVMGKVSDMTMETLKVQHCKLEASKVMEILDVEMEQAKTAGIQRNESKPDITRKVPSKKERTYQGSAYLKGTGKKQTPVIVYGSSQEDIIMRLQGWNATKTEEMKLMSCYIRKYNPENTKYENTVKYDVQTGNDITPIYLNLPHLDKNSYMQVVSEIKKNGAKYNPQKKAFFITRQDNLNLFSKYLPIAGTHTEQRENRSNTALHYDIEIGQKYDDNWAKVTIDGMKPITVYGEEQGVHFPSLSHEQAKEIIEKFVLPTLQEEDKRKENSVKKGDDQGKNSVMSKLNENKEKLQGTQTINKSEYSKESAR